MQTANPLSVLSETQTITQQTYLASALIKCNTVTPQFTITTMSQTQKQSVPDLILEEKSKLLQKPNHRAHLRQTNLLNTYSRKASVTNNNALTQKNLALKEIEDKENQQPRFSRRKFFMNEFNPKPPAMLTPVPASKRSTTHLDQQPVVLLKPNKRM